jgi:hypothetical protein
MHFDAGVVTTFSMDPVVLLSVPLYLAWHGLGGGRAQLADPVLLVEALHRVADRLTVFSQRGRLVPPERAHQLAGLLDSMIYEGTAPHGGAFHAKFWLLRFTADNDEPPLLRLLIPSRNLTADRSWDLCLQLEGRPERTRSKPNKTLVDFLGALPKRCRRQLTDRRRSDVEMLRDEVWRCHWELPGGFTEIRFHALGLDRRPVSWLPERSTELGIISPFLGAKALERLCAATSRPLFLLSRAEEMDKLPTLPGCFEQLLTLDQRAEGVDEDDRPAIRLRGLHAKAYILKCGWYAHLILGSANATDAALVDGINVEILVELIGLYSRVGLPERWLSSEEGMGEMLVAYTQQNSAEAEAPTPEALRLEEVLKGLAALDMELHCEREEDAWSLTLHACSPFGLGDVLLDARPFTVIPERAAAVPILDPEQPVRIGAFTSAEITSLMAFRLTLGAEHACLALNLPLFGGPEDRELAILGQVLRNRETFVRYLLLLLADADQPPPLPGESETVGESGAGNWRGAGTTDVPLFEMLARAWARDPDRLKEVAALVRRLRDTVDERGESVLPPDFLALWQTFEAALAGEAKHDGA